ncbi:MAG: 30S ribosomal protein S18 [bacterium]|nr:30S ribosomal protein S18 [bacterium]
MSRVAKADPNLTFSYKNVDQLYKFINEQGMITPRSRTGLAQKQQRQLTKAIKYARQLAMMPFTQTL